MSACGTQRIFPSTQPCALSSVRGQAEVKHSRLLRCKPCRDRCVLSPLTSYLCPILSKVLVKCLAVYNLSPLWPCILGTAMDGRVEALLADVLALEGEDRH